MRREGFEPSDPYGTRPSNTTKNVIVPFESVKAQFLRYVKVRGLNKYYVSDLMRYLPKLISSQIETPDELMSVLESNKYRGPMVRNYINFLVNSDILSESAAKRFKSVIPKRRSGADNYVPDDTTVINAYNNLKEERFKSVFKILMFSGIRITEAIKMITEFDESKIIEGPNFIKYALSWDRGNKRVTYVYLPKSMRGELHRYYLTKRIVTNIRLSGLAPKYLRKWFYNFLIYNNTPESVADFIEGRAGTTVGSMHYLSKVKQADFWYEKVVGKLEGVFKEAFTPSNAFTL